MRMRRPEGDGGSMNGDGKEVLDARARLVGSIHGTFDIIQHSIQDRVFGVTGNGDAGREYCCAAIGCSYDVPLSYIDVYRRRSAYKG